MAEYQHFDGEAYITMDIIAINEKKNEIELAITDRGRISVTTYDLYKTADGKLYFEYGCMYEKIYIDAFEVM